VELELSIPIYELNNYNGDFYTRTRCESDAKEKLRKLYRETKEAIDGDNLIEAAFNEIVEFAQDNFEDVISDAEPWLSPDQLLKLKEVLNIKEFEEEISIELQKIRAPGLKSFSEYYEIIEFEDSDGGYEGSDFGEMIIGFFSSMKKSWNYNGYTAYGQLEKDFRTSAKKYAEKATKIARKALKKRIERKDRIVFAA
jgi:hypothetical protein